MSTVPAGIARLVAQFDEHADAYRRGDYNETQVRRDFLSEIESWRDALARNLCLRNERLTDRELNFAVQRIIDRIIFLRMCEGRGIEPFGQLQALLNGADVYPRLVEMFHRADEKYNSGLFHFQHEKDREPPDELTATLVVDDKVLKDILVRLYYPESPYEFAALPADILGQVYEQFLGKVIRLTAGHRAKVEEKPEVRKAGGVYYTPTYIDGSPWMVGVNGEQRALLDRMDSRVTVLGDFCTANQGVRTGATKKLILPTEGHG